MGVDSSEMNGNAGGHSATATSNGHVRPADTFLIRALEKMLADREMKKSHSAQLKKQVELSLSTYFFRLLFCVVVSSKSSSQHYMCFGAHR